MDELTPDPTQGIEAPDTTNGVPPIAAEPDAVDAAPDASPAPEQEPLAEDGAVEPQEKALAPRTERRIQQLVSDKKAAMEYGDFWKQRYEAELGGQTPPEPAPEPEPLTPPKLEDFDYDQDAWSQAMLTHATAVANQAADARVQEALQQREQAVQAETIEADFASRVQAFAAEVDDFEEVALNPAIPISEQMGEVIKFSENGPALAYHLGQNVAEAARISQLPSHMQAFELAKVEMSLSTPEKPTVAPTTTQAPAPLEPVGGQQPSISPANESMEDFVKRRWEETKAKRGF